VGEVADGSFSGGPVQLKEVVREDLNPDLALQKIIDKLAKYNSPRHARGDLCEPVAGA
jgi:hypothetical protein